MSRGAWLCVWAATLSGSVRAGDLDEVRSAWSHRRSVSLPSAAGAPSVLAEIDVPPEVAARCQPGLEDLRLVDAEGRDVPYVLDRSEPRESATSWTGRLVDARREKRDESAWTVDLGEPRTFDQLELGVWRRDFAKRIRVEASDDGQVWTLVREDAGIFDRPWQVPVHHTTVELPRTTTARYVRITADDRRSPPIDVASVAAAATRRAEGRVWRRPAAVRPEAAEPGFSRYVLDLPAPLPLERIELEADDAVFARPVRVLERKPGDGRPQERVLGEATLYRLRLEDEALSVESLDLSVQRPQAGEIVVEVRDGDSPPLRNLRVTAIGVGTRLLFPAAPAPVALVLFYGNPVTRPPYYDIEALKSRLAMSAAAGAATLGPEEPNPRFRPAPPLPFAAERGATLAVRAWKSVRRFSVPGREDLYTFALSPEDVGLLRGDLGDVRIVDEGDRQVPFVLEGRGGEGSIELTADRATADPRDPRRGVSRHHLALPPSMNAAAPPIDRIELDFGEPFFARPARLMVPLPERGGERPVFDGVLARGDPRLRIGSLAQPLAIPVGGLRAARFTLEIDEGDNAPLTLRRARAVVQLPRIVFKGGPGPYRLLMGNADTEPPRYDVAALRQEILAYSALPLTVGPREVNPAFRRAIADYFRDTPSSMVLWGALVSAVIVLLLLTARLVRPAPD